MKLRAFAVLVSAVISAPCFSAVVASAAVSSDSVQEIIQNYDVLGVDADGNYVLSQDDYENCVSEILAKSEENEAVKQSKFLKSAQSKAALKSSNPAIDALDEIKNNTRFLQLPGWTGWALDAAEWMIKECLSNPIHAGEEETESELETVPVPTAPVYGQGISSVAKSSAYYSKSGTTEYFELGFNAMTGNAGEGKFEGYIKRYGLGVTATYKLDLAEKSSGDTYAVNVSWTSGTNGTNSTDGLPGAIYSGYRVAITGVSWVNDSGNKQTGSFGDYIFMYNVNKIPVYTNTNTTAVPLSNFLQNARFSENTFYSNSPTYISNHTISANTTNYFNSFDLSTAVNNSYISANTEINNNNYQNYMQYGYYIDNDNNINLDADILADYIANVLKAQFEAAYIDFYQRFPEYGVTVGDDDITYYDPFDDGEDETETLPPETIETYPPVVIFPDAEPKYTLDMEAVHSDLDYVKNQASEINIGRSFWVVKTFEKIMTDTGLFPLFFFVFLMGVLGVLLWK